MITEMANQDWERTLVFVETLTDEAHQDQANTVLAMKRANVDLSSALPFLDRISNAEQRERSALQIARLLVARNPAALSQIARALDLEDHHIESLKAY